MINYYKEFVEKHGTFYPNRIGSQVTELLLTVLMTYLHEYERFIYAAYVDEYNVSDYISSMICENNRKTSLHLNPKIKIREKDPIIEVVPITTPVIPMASISTPKSANLESPPTTTSSKHIRLETIRNTKLNETNSSKQFSSRALYREYKVINSNIEEWTKQTVANL
ncbi:hypothetical protein H8356DRAFT_1359582 [Neocallimastix lanati (nom. inval.)]|nr:hypothetical protein H8356DRAFT_1359582 [Neocallimastix sp. JGI-2020a]